MTDGLDAWLDRAVLDPADLDTGDAEVLVLGEFNHFVHEKGDFRIAMAGQAGRLGFNVWAEELGWSDGRRLARYFETRDEAVFDRLSLFGWSGEARADRDDRPTGIFRASLETYPFALMRAEQTRFYRALSPKALHGFDVAAGHDGGYVDLLARLDATGAPQAWRAALARRPGETLAEEVTRLTALAAEAPAGLDRLARADLSALIDGLTYTGLVKTAATYAETAPAMAFREDAMKRRLASIRALSPGRLVLMGHALHLVRDDAAISAPGIVGPGGQRTSSLGHHVGQELGLPMFIVWMIYGGGEDSQPLPDLPRRADFGTDTLNARLAARFDRPVLLDARQAPDTPVRIAHMYNTVIETALPGAVDALWFVPRVSPLRA